MVQNRSLITASLTVAFLLFTAGCISQPSGEHQSVNTSQNNSLSPLSIVKNRSQCDLHETSVLWVQINPVGDHHIGELLTINGTTNLPYGSILAIDIFPVAPPHTPKYFNLTEWCIRRCRHANVTVMNGISSPNTFSIAYDTTNLNSDEYWAWALDPTCNPNIIMTTQRFNIT
jgi:hypothetical protein